MTPSSSQERLQKTREFEKWWEDQGRGTALQNMLEPAPAKVLAWEAWRKGREQLNEANAQMHMQLARK